MLAKNFMTKLRRIWQDEYRTKLPLFVQKFSGTYCKKEMNYVAVRPKNGAWAYSLRFDDGEGMAYYGFHDFNGVIVRQGEFPVEGETVRKVVVHLCGIRGEICQKS